jgi:FAD-linked oxidoreductase
MIVSRRAAIAGGAGAVALGAAGLTGLALTAGDPAERAALPAPSGKVRWSNWSGLQTCAADAIAVPADLDELRDIVLKASGPVRPVGAGHSFTGLVPTSGTVLSLDRLNALVSNDEGNLTATVGAGVRLFALGEMLEKIGQSMNALPDINKQSLAGAIATATHGAGERFSSLASAVSWLQMMTADGELVECDAANNAELFDAARVSLGALGVITQLRLQNRLPLRLKRRTWFEPIADALAAADTRGREFRHFEFYYVTFTGMAYCISHDETSEPETPRALNPENEGTEDLVMLRDWLSWAPWLRRLVAQGLIANQETESVIGPAWRLLSTDRPRRFNEMEYHIPRDALKPCLGEVIAAVERHNEVYFPIEVRFVASEKAWLSPFYERASASIAIHMGHTQDHSFFFSEIEPIFRRFDGRPHWGKLHSLKAGDLRSLYPRWADFAALRTACDPSGRFVNAHLSRILG